MVCLFIIRHIYYLPYLLSVISTERQRVEKSQKNPSASLSHTLAQGTSPIRGGYSADKEISPCVRFAHLVEMTYLFKLNTFQALPRYYAKLCSTAQKIASPCDRGGRNLSYAVRAG